MDDARRDEWTRRVFGQPCRRLIYIYDMSHAHTVLQVRLKSDVLGRQGRKECVEAIGHCLVAQGMRERREEILSVEQRWIRHHTSILVS